MNPGAIYSKSGKGVQEASGKTSLLKRADRAVLSAIDGRATLAEVAQKVGKPFDAAFEALITQLDKDGFVRAVSGGELERIPASRSGSVPTAKGAPAAAGPDLDFTTIIPIPKAPPKPGDTAKRAKEQESALYKARQEAEARAQAERDRLKAEGEAKARAEAEAKFRSDAEKRIREETEARLKAEAEAKTKAAREAALRIAAEAKAKADAEKARLEAERARLEAERRQREEAERKAREEAEKARREAEELRQRLEEERRAREEAERKAREEEERRRREEEERRAREEQERRAREEAERKAREEEERARRAQEEEAQARRAQEEEQERARQAHEEELERARREAEQAHAPAEPEPAPAPASTATTVVPGSLDTLMADLDSFSQREEDDRKSKDAAERKEKEEKARRLREEAERRAEEQAQAGRRQAEERRRKEEEQRRAQEDAERVVREAEEARRKEAEERQRKAREAMAAAEQPQQAPAPAVPPLEDIGITDQDLDMEDVRRDEALVAKETRKAQREREAREREREERQRAREREHEERERERRAAGQVKPSKPRKPVKWGRRVAITLVVLLAAAIGVLHVVPIPTEPYERAASEVLGHPVRIGSGHLSLYNGVRLNLERLKIGETANIASARAYPELGSLSGERKAFSRIEIDNATLAPQALGEVLFAKMKGANFSVGRVVVNQLKLEGGLALPPLEAEVQSGPDGAVRAVTLRGPDNLVAKITPRGGNVEFEVTASSFALPVAPAVSLTSFAMKGTATRQGMNVASWGGALFDGAVNGVANVRWAGGWHIDGVVTVRNINAAVFAPALLSEGRAEGTAKFSMNAQDPDKLAGASRIEGKFTIYKGVLGSFDLSRLIQTSGRQSSGRTQFAEMTGQGTYDRGAVALREVQISAGALNAGASADIAHSGALSGRIIADVKTATQTLRQTVLLGGTVKEPQVRN